jgi:hypothetical protein
MLADGVQDLGQRHLPATDHDHDHRHFFGDRSRQIKHHRRLCTPRFATRQDKVRVIGGERDATAGPFAVRNVRMLDQRLGRHAD